MTEPVLTQAKTRRVTMLSSTDNSPANHSIGWGPAYWELFWPFALL
jgi:hypothetical protein